MFRRKITRYNTDDIILHEGENIIEVKDKITLKSDETDIKYEVKKGDDLRGIAYKIYDEARLYWVIAEYNNILDPFKNLEEGRILTCPTLKRLLEEGIV